MQDALTDRNPDLDRLSYCQLRYIVKKVIRLTYHKVGLRAKAVLTEENAQQRSQVAGMLLALRSLGFVTVFVDEYAHNDKALSRYGWARAG